MSKWSDKCNIGTPAMEGSIDMLRRIKSTLHVNVDVCSDYAVDNETKIDTTCLSPKW